jgi:hypothetical protein
VVVLAVVKEELVISVSRALLRCLCALQHAVAPQCISADFVPPCLPSVPPRLRTSAVGGATAVRDGDTQYLEKSQKVRLSFYMKNLRSRLTYACCTILLAACVAWLCIVRKAEEHAPAFLPPSLPHHHHHRHRHTSPLLRVPSQLVVNARAILPPCAQCSAVPPHRCVRGQS